MDTYSQMRATPSFEIVTGKPVVLGGSSGRQARPASASSMCGGRLRAHRADLRERARRDPGLRQRRLVAARELYAIGAKVIAGPTARRAREPAGLDIAASSAGWPSTTFSAVP